jgi:hypothetical protein
LKSFDKTLSQSCAWLPLGEIPSMSVLSTRLDPVAELGRLYGAVSAAIVLVPSATSVYLYDVKCVSDKGDFEPLGHAKLDDGEAELVFFNRGGKEMHRVTRTRPAFNDLLRLHVHERKAISFWTPRECRRFIRQVLGPEHKLGSANVSLTGKMLMTASAKDLKLKKADFLLLHEHINAEMVLGMEKQRLEESLLVMPPPLEDEDTRFGTIKGIATVLGIDPKKAENLSQVDTLRLLLSADAPNNDKVVKHSSVTLADVLSLFEADLSLSATDASEARQHLDQLSDPAVHDDNRVDDTASETSQMTHEELCDVVAQQGRRIDQLEALIATIMAQLHGATTSTLNNSPKARAARLSSSTGGVGSPKFPRLIQKPK